jgi:hypothetical protein
MVNVAGEFHPVVRLGWGVRPEEIQPLATQPMVAAQLRATSTVRSALLPGRGVLMAIHKQTHQAGQVPTRTERLSLQLPNHNYTSKDKMAFLAEFLTTGQAIPIHVPQQTGQTPAQ